MARLGERKSIRLESNDGLATIRANLLADPQQTSRRKLMFGKSTGITYANFSLPVWLKRGYELYRVRNSIIEWDSTSRTFRLVPKVTMDTLVATSDVTKNKFKWLVDETLVTLKNRDLGDISNDIHRYYDVITKPPATKPSSGGQSIPWNYITTSEVNTNPCNCCGLYEVCESCCDAQYRFVFDDRPEPKPKFAFVFG